MGAHAHWQEEPSRGLSQPRWLRNLTAVDRSKQTFERLYARLGERLLVYLTRRTQDVDVATELWAECWASAFSGWSRCRAGSEGEEEAWVLGIARRQLAGYFRSGAVAQRNRERLRWLVPEVSHDERAELERQAELDSLRESLAGVMADLPEQRRRAVELRVVSGLPYAEVASRMGCSEQAARASVSRGLRRLAELLQDDKSIGGAG